MRNYKKFYAKITVTATVFLLLAVSANAASELVLRGTIIDVDRVTKVVKINVQSSICPGVRSFSFDISSGLNSGMTGENLTFKINSPTCGNSNTLYLLTPLKM